MRDAQAEAKRLLLLKYSNRWVWDIFMEDARTFAVRTQIAKYGHFAKRAGYSVCFGKRRDKSSRPKKKKKREREKRSENAYLLYRLFFFKTKGV